MNNSVKPQRSIGLALFGSLFFLAAAALLILRVMPTFYDGWRMSDWPSVKGELLSANLKISYGDSTTYQATARYRYFVREHEYVNDRPAINGGNDNIGTFQQDLGYKLKNIFHKKQHVKVFYNPDDPADSILNREIRWGLQSFTIVFVLVFGLVGGGIMYAGLRTKKIIDTPESKDKPWLQNPDWKCSVIHSQAKSGMKAIWFFAIIWNLISTPIIAIGFIEVWNDEGYVALMMLLFPLIGLGLLYAAIKKTLEWRRFGITALSMDPYPGSIGGDVAGGIDIDIPYDPMANFKVTLTCVHSYMSGSGKNRSRSESAQWQDSGYARVQPAAGGITLKFCFKVPQGLKESEEHSSNYYFWRLNVEADLDGVDLDRSYEIPVFATAECSQTIALDSTVERPAGLPQVSAETILPIVQTSGVIKIYYPMFRKLPRAFAAVLFGGIFFGAGLFLWVKAADDGFMLYIMSSVFSLIGGGIMLWGLYSGLNSLMVQLDGQTLKVVRSILGFTTGNYEVSYNEIERIEASEGMKSSSGNKHTIEYKVVAVSAKHKLTLAEHLDSASQKKIIIEYYKEKLKIK